MYSEKIVVFILTAFCLWGQVHSQDRPPVAFVNGPTGTSADALDDKQKAPEGTFVNGPTAFSVEAEEQLKEQAGEFVEVEEILKDSNDTTGPAYMVTDVDLQDQVEDDQVEPKQFVNGHSGASAHSLQQNADADFDASAARGRISTDPKEDKKTEKKIEGFHTHTSDFSTDAPQWSFKGGEWSLVTLPDPDNHPNLPADTLPSPALVVVTTEPLAKVHASRILEGMENVTLHFGYFLSEGELPDGRPSLNVYQVKDDSNMMLLATPTTRGVWDTISVDLPYSGDSKIVFEGQRKRADNEIAIDDITISGYHVHPEKAAAAADGEETNDDQATETPQEKEEGSILATESPDIEPTTEEEAVAVTEASEDGTEEEAGNVTEKTQETDGEENDDTQVSETSTEQTDQAEQTTASPEDEQPEITTVDSAIDVQGNDSVGAMGENNSSAPAPTAYNPAIDYNNNDLKQDNETEISDGTVDRLDANTTSNITDNSSLSTVEMLGEETKATMDERENATVPNTDNNITTLKMNDSLSGATTELPNANQTGLSYESTDLGNGGDGNETEISVISTSSSNLSGTTDNINETDHNDTNTTNNVVYTTMYPESVGTEPNAMTNQTDLEVTDNQAGNTSAVNVTGEGNDTSVYVTHGITTLGVSNPPEGEGSSDQDNATNPYDKTTLIHLTLAPPGVYNTSQESGSIYGNGTDSSVTSDNDDIGSSWGVFKVFLVITLLGIAILGFLYWRRQKRRDDEIPVFTRDSHSDYHNPTFDDDDYNFASKGTGHNYKSFD